MISRAQIIAVLIVILYFSFLLYWKISKDKKCESICSQDNYVGYFLISTNYYCICENNSNVYIKALK